LEVLLRQLFAEKKRGMLMKFSNRSQTSFSRQRELASQLQRAELQARLCAERIEKETANIERLADGATKNAQSHDAMYLRQHAEILASEKMERRTYLGLARRLRTQIEALRNPPASALAERRKIQQRLAGIALERAKLDKSLGEALDRLLDLLEKRERLTDRLHDGAGKIELSIPSEPWEADIAMLAGQLPDVDTFARRAEEWANRFVGRKQELRKYTRLSDFTLPETLVAHHVYNEGGEAYLTEADAVALLERPDPPIREIGKTKRPQPQELREPPEPRQQSKNRFEGWHMAPPQ
jgi:hypothetical protein